MQAESATHVTSIALYRVRARSHFGHVQTVSSSCFIRGRLACAMRRDSRQSLRRCYRLHLSCVNVRMNLESLVSSNLGVPIWNVSEDG